MEETSPIKSMSVQIKVSFEYRLLSESGGLDDIVNVHE